MKKIFKKNQVIITTLALMIAVAGYLNYSGKIFGDKKEEKTVSSNLANKELLDISQEDEQTSGEIQSNDLEVADRESEGTPGEAILTSAEASNVVAEAKVSREQVRAKNKETLQTIIDNANLSNEQKADAINQMISMTAISEKEVSVETLLASKGFHEAVVSLTTDTADIVVTSSELTDANRAQIEDIVSRKAEIAPENIVITPIHTGK
ncbi:MAG: SpoIIIAH-like family protein [Lachnospiraceae bacterium]